MLNFNEKNYSNISSLGIASAYVEDIWAEIEHIELLRDFTLDEVKVICHYLHCYAAPRGFTLFEPDNQADHLILILSGGVRLNDANGAEEATEYRLGAVLGECSLVEQHPWHATCVTIVPTDFAILTRQSLNEMLMNHPRLGNKLLLGLMRKIATRSRVHHKDSIDSLLQVL
jgi:hypothetical protein